MDSIMKTFVILSFLTISLFALNPKVYSSLGDVIYDDVDEIASLQEIQEYEPYTKAIKKYVLEVSETKKHGFSIEDGDKNVSAKKHLAKLRSLFKQHETLIKSVHNNFYKSMQNNDSSFFSSIINSGLIDVKKNKKIIMKYYLSHIDDVGTAGVVQKFLDKDAKLREQAKKKRMAWYKHQIALEHKKIQRLRKADKEKKAEIENKLEIELTNKKKSILQNQHKELFN